MLTLEQVEEIVFNLDIEMAEDCEVEIDGIKYYLVEVERDGWHSDGKYEDATFIYELTSSKDGVEAKTGYFVRQGVDRTGSYYSDYYYEYGEFEIVKQIEETIVVKKWVKVEEEK